MIPDARDLSTPQLLRLEKLGEELPEPKVIGWRNGGPLVQRGVNVYRVSPLGRLAKQRLEMDN